MTRSVFTKRYRRLLELLRNSRIQAGLTQVEVAKRLKRPQSFVSKAEAGERRMDLIELVELCELYGADIHAIVDQLLQL